MQPLATRPMPEISAARRTDAVPSLLDSLDARAGIVCFVGAGGKKTAIGRLARLHPGRVGIASTTKIPPLPGKIEALLEFRIEASWQIAGARCPPRRRRVARGGAPQPDVGRLLAVAWRGHHR